MLLIPNKSKRCIPNGTVQITLKKITGNIKHNITSQINEKETNCGYTRYDEQVLCTKIQDIN